MSSITVGCYERFVWRFDVDTEKDQVSLEKVAGFEAHEGPVRCVEGSGSLLASSGSDNNIRLYDAANGDGVRSFETPSSDVQCLAFVPRNETTTEPTHLLGGAKDGSISVWDVNVKRLGVQLMGHKSGVNSIAVHRAGKLAFSTSRDSKLLLWDLIRGKKVHTGQLSKESKTIAFHPDGESYVIACDDSIHLTSLESAQELQVWTHDRKITCMSVLQKRGLVATGTEDGAIRVWDSRLGEKPCIEVKDAHSTRLRGIHGMDGSEALANAIATGCSNGIVKMWDLRSTSKQRFDAGCLCSAEAGARITCLTTSSPNVPSHPKAKTKKKKRKNRPDVIEETDPKASSSRQTERLDDASDETLESISDDDIDRTDEIGIEPMGSGSGGSGSSDDDDDDANHASLDDAPMDTSTNGDMIELNLESESDDSDMEEVTDESSDGGSSDGEDDQNDAGSSDSREDVDGDVALENGVSEIQANSSAGGSGKRRVGQDDVAEKGGEGRKGKKRQRKSNMEGDVKKVQKDKPSHGGAPVTPPTAGASPGPSEPPSKLRSALKTGDRNCSDGSGKKKTVRFKDDDNIVEVLGYASGVGFDSVIEPNLKNLMVMVGGRGRGRGRGGGRGNGKKNGGMLDVLLMVSVALHVWVLGILRLRMSFEVVSLSALG
ncbi:hypothetical protein BSKO_12991 [Bryopsis sp. KO-2023]|nr:hypothetical protein BSKO_12991 [Bryopsis sp. KO-2023]